MYYIVSTKTRIAISSLLIWIIFSSLFYLALNYRYYYLANEWNIESQSKQMRDSIDNMISLIKLDTTSVNDRKFLEGFIKEAPMHVEIEKTTHEGWKIDNGFILNENRTIIDSPKFKVGDSYVLKMKRHNQPPWYVHLLRAWTISYGEGFGTKSWYRSEPLFMSCVITMVLMAIFYSLMIKNYNQYLQIESEKEKIKDEYGNLLTTLNKMKSEKENLRKKLTDIGEEKNRLEVEISKAKKSSKEKTDELLERLREKEHEYEKLWSEMEEMDKIEDQASNKIKEIEISRENKDLRKRVDQLTTDINKYEVALQNSRSRETGANKTIKTLENVFNRIRFSKKSIKELSENSLSKSMFNFITEINNGQKIVRHVEYEKWNQQNGECYEYKFGRGRRIIIEHFIKDKPLVHEITFSHKHAK